MSIMSPHPTEKEGEECEASSLENGNSTLSREEAKNTNGNILSTASVTTEVGAKRRKPLKTNKVTQQIQVTTNKFF